VVAQLHAELTADAADAVIAYRGTHRWVQAYEAARLETQAEASIPLQAGGSYLILGGLDGIGLALAKHLAGNFAAKLTLARDPGSASPDPAALAALGSDILLLEIDTSNQSQLESALAQAQTRFGQLNGVIYVGEDFGKTGFSPLADTKKEDYEARISSASRALQALDGALADKELDFCLVTSSLSSVLGGLGLASYAATYCYVDAFTRQHNRISSYPWVNVNWDSWKFTGTQKSSFNDRLDSLSITPEEGGRVFERILAHREAAQLIVSTADLHGRLQAWVAHETGSGLSETSVTLHARPELATPYVAPRNEIEQQIAQIWQALLGIDAVGIHDNFFELGGHSLLAVQIISRMRSALGIDLPLNNLFEKPTIAFLADYVATVRWALQDQAASQTEGRQEIEL
jgi:acyl carrier protein